MYLQDTPAFLPLPGLGICFFGTILTPPDQRSRLKFQKLSLFPARGFLLQLISFPCSVRNRGLITSLAPAPTTQFDEC